MSFSPDALALRPDFCFLLGLPLLTAALGWLANRVLLLFLFGPLPAQGLWHHGVLAAQPQEPARELALQLARHLQMAELFRLMEPEKIAAHLGESVAGRLEEYVDGIMAERHAVLWDNLPLLLRQRIYARVRRQLPLVLDNMIDDMAENIEAVVDVQGMTEAVLQQEPGLLSRLYAGVLPAEQAFLLRAGAIAGLLAGLAVAWLWCFYPRPSWLPLLMAVAMALAVALPRRLLLDACLPGGRTGWMHRPGASVAPALAGWLSVEVLSLRRLMQLLLSGDRAVRTRAMIRRHLRPLLEAGRVRTTIQLLLGGQGYVDIKQLALDRTVSLTVGSLSDAGFSQDRAAEVEDACAMHLSRLGPVDMEKLVRPVLQYRWWQQVVLAMAIGMLAGMAQWLCLLAK